MNILIISQCNKLALVETRRIIDQFAERKGSRTWQTQITHQGVLTLRKMLRKTARKNTAVACHWLKKDGNSEILWLVGNIRMFNSQGTVPTNWTGSDILRTSSENNWHTLEDISLLSGIAGLFHDFGKANYLFQKKISPKTKAPISEPYRHEWVSLRLFQAFVGDLSDKGWLEKMGQKSNLVEDEIKNSLIRDGLESYTNPFSSLPPLAKCVAWLVLSHHRLPFYPANQDNKPNVKYIDEWLEEFEPFWNSPQCMLDTWKKSDFNKLWDFAKGLPFSSETWLKKSRFFSRRALNRPRFYKTDWWPDIFSLHIARLTLMLSDHVYSAKNEVEHKWQDKKYKAYANTDKTGKLKQKLDEHLIGVGHYGYLFSKSLPNLQVSLPSISYHRGFKKHSSPPFSWQNKAYQLSCSIAPKARKNGFFGINMASTGCGKTLANGRIIYGLADEKKGCRFSVALGLRSLTLQTGNALRERLKLEDDDLAVLIGSQAVKDLYRVKEDNEDEKKFTGSESEEDFFPEDNYIRYEGSPDSSFISRWIAGKNLNKIISAPILVSTVDHLVPCTEGIRGGKQIAPMLRLLTSDLILDEPDDFDLADLPALTRLVHWAGLLGSKVLLSSATLPPALVQALFEAYRSGRKYFQKACAEESSNLSIPCAWFDEYGVVHSDHQVTETFNSAHNKFVTNRVENLEHAEVARLVQIVPVIDEEKKLDKKSASSLLTKVIYQSIYELHEHHKLQNPNMNREISIGLIRMANINPLVAITKELMQLAPHENFRVHYCIYHSQHPLIVRSNIEHQLDSLLARHNPDSIWDHEEIKSVLSRYPEKKQIFIVMATPVAEIGRDHDYDWAICEPSSIRSIIQLAGRVLRHRKMPISSPNISVLSHNYRGLTVAEGAPAFTRPGFESQELQLIKRDVRLLLDKEQYEKINAAPRIIERDVLIPQNNLVDLEHCQLRDRLLQGRGRSTYAALWWRFESQWSAEIQNRTPFRQSTPENKYIMKMTENGEEPKFFIVDKYGEAKLCESHFKREEFKPCEGNCFWLTQEASHAIEDISGTLDMDLEKASKNFGTFRLRVTSSNTQSLWNYNRYLGFYNDT